MTSYRGWWAKLWRSHGKQHPMQPVVEDSEGVVRFQANDLVRDLLDGLLKPDLNVIVALVARGRYCTADYEQLMQLVGYSVSGYGDLSRVRPESIARADALAQALQERAP